MITVEKSPGIDADGIFASLSINFDISGGWPIAGETFVIVYSNGLLSKTFNFIDVSTGSPTEIITNTGAYTLLDDYLISEVIPVILGAIPGYSADASGAIVGDLVITATSNGYVYNLTMGDYNVPAIKGFVASPGKYPACLVAGKSPVEFLLETNAYLTTAGVKAYIDFTFTGMPGSTNPFTLTFLGRTLNFTFENTRDTSGLQLQITGSFTNWVVDYFIPQLKENFYLSQDYDIVLHTTNVVRVISKKYGTKYNITGTETVTNMTLGTPVAGVDEVYAENFRMLFDLHTESAYLADDFTPIFDNDGIPDANNQCLFDIRVVLAAILKTDTPPFTGSNIYNLSKCFRRFFVRHAEYFGSDPTVQIYRKVIPNTAYLATDDVFSYLAIAAARAFLNEGSNINADYLLGYQLAKFLTMMPNGIMVDKDQHNFLHAFIPAIDTGSFTIKLKAQILFTDGTYSSVLTIASSSAAHANKIVSFRVGYTQMDLGSHLSGKIANKYTVWLEYGDNYPITETRTFQVSQNRHQNRYFLFFNSFGLPEIAFFYGVQGREADFMRTEIRRNKPLLDSTNKIFDGDQEQIYPEFKRSFDLATGYKPKNYLAYFIDFMNSSKHYEQLSDKYVGISIPRQNITLDDDNQRVFGLKFKYTEAFTERGNA